MITSIVVTGCYNIKMNGNKKIKVNDNVLSVEKDIPFIRYRFDTYEEKEYNYIKSMMEQFNCSTHLAEINLSESASTVAEQLNTRFGNLAKYVYIEVTDADVERGELTQEVKTQLVAVKQFNPDRYMLRDKTTCLDMIGAKKIIKDACKAIGETESNFGVCSSPLSFGDMACLTAVKARELMSIYSPIADVALPSANHQCMNCCGCIRYATVSEDLEAPADSKAKTTKKSDNSEIKEKKAPAKTKKSGGPKLIHFI